MHLQHSHLLDVVTANSRSKALSLIQFALPDSTSPIKADHAGSALSPSKVTLMPCLLIAAVEHLEVLSILTLAKLHVLVLTSFIKLIKLLQNLVKLLPNHIMVWGARGARAA